MFNIFLTMATEDTEQSADVRAEEVLRWVGEEADPSQLMTSVTGEGTNLNQLMQMFQ